MKTFLVVSCLVLTAFLGIYNSTISIPIAQRGCCSHHGGVCGCSYGRSKCCDGTLSPSCTCFKDDEKIGFCNVKKDIFITNIIK